MRKNISAMFGAFMANDAALVASQTTSDLPEANPAGILNEGKDTPIAYNVVEKFFFKKDELGNKRDTVSLTIPVPTAEGIAIAMQDEKQRNFILSVMQDVVKEAVRQQVNDEEKPVNKQDELDITKVTLEYLANLPPAERRGGGIAKEKWAEFAKNYIEVMPAVTNKTKDAVENASKLLLAKFQPVKTNKKVIKFLQEQLALWFTNTSDECKQEFAECFEFLNEKAEALMQADEAALLANL